MTTKDQVIKVIQELPQDACIEDAMEKLYLLYRNRREAPRLKSVIGLPARANDLRSKARERSRRGMNRPKTKFLVLTMAARFG